MTTAIDAHVHLDVHSTHAPAVTAVLTGPQAHVAGTGLEAAGWTTVAENTLVLARIDREKPYWAQDAAKHLIDCGITVDVTPRLQKEMDEEWTWANYPMPWCTRDEIREVSDRAQKLHDDIREGHPLIHAHAPDGDTTVAVGTYLAGSMKSVYLHGENHLRQVAGTLHFPAQALSMRDRTAFHYFKVSEGPRRARSVGDAHWIARDSSSRHTRWQAARLSAISGSMSTMASVMQVKAATHI